jgi:hypothetical protein
MFGVLLEKLVYVIVRSESYVDILFLEKLRYISGFFTDKGEFCPFFPLLFVYVGGGFLSIVFGG